MGFNGRRSKLLVLLIASFVVVGLVSSCLSYRLLGDQVMRDAQTDLISTAKLIAMQIDGDRHKALTSPKDMESPSYRDLTSVLRTAKATDSSIKYVYTLIKVNGKVFFVLDPTEPGDSDGDGVDDKSYLMDEYSEADQETFRILDRMVPDSGKEISTDRWGSFLTGYAPILDSSGKPVAMLGVDRDAKDIEAVFGRLRQVALLAFVLITGLGALLSWIITRLGTSEAVSGRFELNRSGIGVFAQGLLTVLGLAAVAAGIYGYSASSADEAALKARGDQLVRLVELNSLLTSLALDETAGLETLHHLGERASKEGLNTISEIARGAERKAVDGRIATRLFIPAMVQSSRDSAQLLDSSRSQILARMRSRHGQFSFVLWIAAALALASVAVLRVATIQEQRLRAAKEQTQQSEREYRHVVESLPMGLIKYAGSCIVASNWTADRQTGRLPGESSQEAFARCLHPADRDSFFALLDLHEARQMPFSLQFRLDNGFGAVSYYEAHGVPIFDESGSLVHMLCFNVEITPIVEANRILLEKNSEVAAANDRLQDALGRLAENFDAMVQSLVKAVEAKDPYTAGHSERVMRYSMAIGHECGLSEEELQILKMGTLVHDVGKIGIPDSILTKPGRLTAEEFSVIKRHTLIGAQMIENIPQFADCVPIVRWHHERLDGSGYPDGVKGDRLSALVRIAAIADCFDAMTSTRAYRKGLPPEIALEELEKEVELGRLDGKFVAMLADIIRREGVIENLYSSVAA